MHDVYKQQVLESLRGALDVSEHEYAEHKAFKLIRDRLVEFGVPTPLANRAVAKAQISVDADLLTDETFMSEVTFLFAKVMLREYLFARDALQHEEVFLDLIEGMSLTLAPPQ